jgi:AbrB family looped-hinge helix DNA binding protein
MTIALISSKFQVVIPRDVRAALQLAPGQRVEARAVGNKVELTPIPSMASARGLFTGIDTHVPNDEETAHWPGGVAPDARVVLTKARTTAKIGKRQKSK